MHAIVCLSLASVVRSFASVVRLIWSKISDPNVITISGFRCINEYIKSWEDIFASTHKNVQASISWRFNRYAVYSTFHQLRQEEETRRSNSRQSISRDEERVRALVSNCLKLKLMVTFKWSNFALKTWAQSYNIFRFILRCQHLYGVRQHHNKYLKVMAFVSNSNFFNYY